MRIAVIGGTGAVGRLTVAALRKAGHEPVVIARSTGVDVVSGKGLDAALAGCDAAIDVTYIPVSDATEARLQYGAAATNMLAAEQRTGVAHHVLLSIVGLERIEGNAHYHGKREQERLVAVGRIPYTIQRATQFHDFAAMVTGWMTRDGVATVPPLLMQTVATADVADVLAEVATGAPQGRAPDLAGPEPQDLIDQARRTLAARGQSVRLVPSWRSGLFGVDASGEALLPSPGARIAPTTFDAWLAAEKPKA